MFRSSSKSFALRRRLPLRFEILEDRSVPAVFAVTNLLDSGVGSLRQAVINANSNNGSDNIVIQVTGTVTLEGQIVIDDDVNIVGPGSAFFTVSGDNNSRIFLMDDDSSNSLHVSISGMTLTGGEVGEDSGGAILIGNEELILKDVTIQDCTADAGGAIFVSDNGRLTVDNCTISGNSATFGEGGAVYFRDNATGQFRDSTISGNSARDDGGAIYASYFVALSFERCTISNNTADNQQNNSSDGGAIFIQNDSGLNIQDSTINGNSSSGVGGGICSGTGDFHISNTTISGNTAFDGGGIYIGSFGGADRPAGGYVVPSLRQIRHTTITGNAAVGGDDNGGENGGDYGGEARPAVIAGNGSSGAGGGIFTQRDFDVRNSIIAGNSAATDPDLHTVNESTVAIAFSLLQEQGGASISDDGGNIFDVDPLLGPLQNNGGKVRTHALLAGSPALNTGDPAFKAPPVFDERGPGFNRVALGRIDMGAFEQQAAVIPPQPIVRVNFSAVGADDGTSTLVRVYANDGKLVTQFEAYPNYQFGVRVATADVTGDGIDDIITAPGAGGGPHVQVFDGAKLDKDFVVFPDRIVNSLGSFFSYNPSFSGGVFVGTGDVNGDGLADIITGADSGGGPHVIAWNVATGKAIVSFFAYDINFAGGVRVAGGDVDADGFAEIITGAGPTGGPHVKVFNSSAAVVKEFFAYDAAFAGGVYVAAGDVNADGRADIITGAGAGGGPHVKAFSGVNLAALASIFVYDPIFLGGVRVAAADFNNDGRAEMVFGAGPGGGPHVRAVDNLNNQLTSFYAFDLPFEFGIFVG